MRKAKGLDEAAAALRELILAGEWYRQIIAEHLNVTISESQAISYLFARGVMGQGELGAALGFNTSSTTALVDRLEKHALAERLPDPNDRRRSFVRLTTNGHEAITIARDAFFHAFNGINHPDLARLTEQLTTLATGLRDRADAFLAEAPRQPPL